MINGPWGSGKTFFVKKYFDDRKQKTSPTSDASLYLYVSLYGVNNFKQIEQSFFRQLHPMLARKEVAIATEFLKGALKTALKVDINGFDVTINSQIPSIDLVDLMSDSKYVIVFDDLERCSMPIVDMLGYINSFVEHKQKRVIIIANEEEIRETVAANDGAKKYTVLKEKLVGKTFAFSPSGIGPIESFISEVSDKDVHGFLRSNSEYIEKIYVESKIYNLRSLRVAILEFARIMANLDP